MEQAALPLECLSMERSALPSRLVGKELCFVIVSDQHDRKCKVPRIGQQPAHSGMVEHQYVGFLVARLMAQLTEILRRNELLTRIRPIADQRSREPGAAGES